MTTLVTRTPCLAAFSDLHCYKFVVSALRLNLVERVVSCVGWFGHGAYPVVAGRVLFLSKMLFRGNFLYYIYILYGSTTKQGCWDLVSLRLLRIPLTLTVRYLTDKIR